MGRCNLGDGTPWGSVSGGLWARLEGHSSGVPCGSLEVRLEPGVQKPHLLPGLPRGTYVFSLWTRGQAVGQAVHLHLQLLQSFLQVLNAGGLPQRRKPHVVGRVISGNLSAKQLSTSSRELHICQLNVNASGKKHHHNSILLT